LLRSSCIALHKRPAFADKAALMMRRVTVSPSRFTGTQLAVVSLQRIVLRFDDRHRA
jgi:hypothetical protein